MADALVSALVSTVLGNLNSSVLQELGLARGLESDLEDLKRNFIAVQAVLQDAEEKRWKSEAVKIWLRDLKDAAYDADDVLEDITIEAQRRRRQQLDFTKRVRSFFSLDHNPFVFRVRMAHKLKSVREKFDAVACMRQNFHFVETPTETKGDGFDWRQTGSLVDESEIQGRDEEKEELINLILTHSNDLSVYAVCGMGGLGKTTLAQLVYNNATVKEHFDLQIWVCVSTDFDIQRIARAIIESTEGSSCSIQELALLQRRLQEKVTGKRFLLVLDDIWDHHCEKWNRLKEALRFGARGSVVLVTTRIESVALLMESVFVQHLSRLSDDNSWHLFEKLALSIRSGEDYELLESVGKAIVSKCGGVPLAIKVIGTMMRSKRTKNEWSSILESELWDLPDDGSFILSALKLSYYNLSPHLKQCFALCSLFPKGYEMRKDQLVELWMANGFIPCKRQMDLHEMGHQMFDELVGRSFFQDIEEGEKGNFTCKMHDFLHDLAQTVSKSECCLFEDGRIPEVPTTVRHVTFFQRYATPCNEDLLKVRSLRSFLSTADFRLVTYSLFSIDSFGLWRDEFSLYLSRQKYLRILNLVGYKFQQLPVQIANLKHLRHLDVSESLYLRTLPESIISLHYLQTLNLRDCWSLYKLPKEMKQMKNLIYLDLRGCDDLRSMPSGMGQLTCLRKLGVFIVGKQDGHRIGELQTLNHIGGELSIKDLGNVENLADAQSADLMRKTNLQALCLFWGDDDDGNHRSKDKDEEVLCGLHPNSNLKYILISGYGGTKFPNWMMELRLQNLFSISLESCSNCENLPPFGKLQFLKYLTLKKMETMKIIGSDLYGDGENPFPSLETLWLGPMRSLEHWTANGNGGRVVFTHLHDLWVVGCPQLVELPIISSVKKLHIQCCNVSLLSSVAHFMSLTDLSIRGFRDLALLPDGLLQNFSHLQSLSIQELGGLQSLSNQFDNLSSLKSLEISYCYLLESLPEGLENLNSLESMVLVRLPIADLLALPSSLTLLDINYCDALTSLSEGLEHVKALKDLLLNGCPKLDSLPESIQHLTSLQSLKIWNCVGLSCLPGATGHLASLSTMSIIYCPKLMSLPEEMRSLHVLRELSIDNSPILERRCKKENGDDWPKIAHIPKIVINNQAIQSLEHQD